MVWLVHAASVQVWPHTASIWSLLREVTPLHSSPNFPLFVMDSALALLVPHLLFLNSGGIEIGPHGSISNFFFLLLLKRNIEHRTIPFKTAV